MPIIRTYACEDCFHQMEVTLTAEQWDNPSPECPACSARQMQQQFRPVAIGGSNHAKAARIAEDIAATDYHVADMSLDGKGGQNKVRYKDQNQNTAQASSWGVAQEALQGALQAGRQNRLLYGNGLDVLQTNIRNGTEPDLIEMSKKRSIKIW